MCKDNYIPFDDIISASVFKTANDTTTKFVSLDILAPSPDNLIFNVKDGSSKSMIFC